MIDLTDLLKLTRSIFQALSEGETALQQLKTEIKAEKENAMELSKTTKNKEKCKIIANMVISTNYLESQVDRLIEDKICSTQDFFWKSTFRYYWEEENLQLRIVEAAFMYGYEYFGSYERLVMTELTEKCYQVLSVALHQIKGGSVEGPTGTGKSETVKDISKACGKQCIVFNCSEGLDYRPLGKFIKGLACSGAWSCFDEFHRIKRSVLSIVSHDILTLHRGIQAQMSSMMLGETDIVLNPTCAIFITMKSQNSLEEKIPDNFKALFRSVAMIKPDSRKIAEVCLSAKGFTKSKLLSRKLTSIFQLCHDTLSVQPHYEFGLRSIKSVLELAETLKLESEVEVDEIHIIFNAIHRLKFSELLPHDQKLFLKISRDIFPEVEVNTPIYEKIQNALETVCEKKFLDCHPYLQEKVQQLHQMIRDNICLTRLTYTKIEEDFEKPTFRGHVCKRDGVNPCLQTSANK